MLEELAALRSILADSADGTITGNAGAPTGATAKNSDEITRFIDDIEGLRKTCGDEVRLDDAVEAYRSAMTRCRELEATINQGPAVVFLTEAAESWPVVFVSDNIRMYGYTPDEFSSQGLSFIDIIHPADRDHVQGYHLAFPEPEPLPV